MKKIIELLNEPKIIEIVGDQNSGKTNLINDLLVQLEGYERSLYYYGLKFDWKGVRIGSVEELENIRDSIIILDEFNGLFDLNNTKKFKSIENTIRLIYHHNNILILAGLGENFKKFISNKAHAFIFMNLTLGDLINGSKTKDICLSYRGDEMGSRMLSLGKDEAITYNGKHYYKLKIPYHEEFDTKKDNKQILVKKSKKSDEKELKKIPEKNLKKAEAVRLETK